MKLNKYLATGSLLALMALAGGCSSEEEPVGNGPDIVVPAEGTTQLVFNFGGLRLAGAGATRAEAIATEDETIVDNLLIILTGVDDETHTTKAASVVYEYRSTWATPPVETNRYKKLTLTQSGNVLTGKLTVDEAVMLPSLLSKRALVLVNGVKARFARNGAVADLAGSADFVGRTDEDIYLLCGGTYGGNNLAAAGGSMELACDPADPSTADIACPLPMSARIDNINFHGSTNINVQLRRHVSRFDLRNGQNAQLRIGSIRPLAAATGIAFDPARDTRVDMLDQSFLPHAVAADWANVPSEVVPAFYTFPSALEVNAQPMKFRVTAKKLNAATGAWEDKTYTLSLEDADRKPVSIDANTRYVINITEVTDLHLMAAITVAEWEQGGDIDGDLNPSTASRKAPALADLADDAAHSITWTTDGATHRPTALNFGKAYNGLSIAFSTPAEAPVDPADPTKDQPKVTVDIFKEAGANNPGSVWLKATQAVVPTTRAAAGDILHTLTVVAPADGLYPVLWVKVKNYYFPEQFVMFRVTGVASDKILIDTSGDNPVSVPDGWTTDPGNDEFNEGTVGVPPAPIVAANTVYRVNGYWVTAPDANLAKQYKWAASNSATVMDNDPCAGHGNWRMPTMKDFEKMLGWTNTWPWSQRVGEDAKEILSDKVAWNAAFPIGDFPVGRYWSSDACDIDITYAWFLEMENSGVAKYSVIYKNNDSKVIRCVQPQ